MSFRWDSLFPANFETGSPWLIYLQLYWPQFPYLRNPAHLPYLKLRTMEELFAIHRS